MARWVKTFFLGMGGGKWILILGLPVDKRHLEDYVAG